MKTLLLLFVSTLYLHAMEVQLITSRLSGDEIPVSCLRVIDTTTTVYVVDSIDKGTHYILYSVTDKEPVLRLSIISKEKELVLWEKKYPGNIVEWEFIPMYWISNKNNDSYALIYPFVGNYSRLGIQYRYFIVAGDAKKSSSFIEKSLGRIAWYEDMTTYFPEDDIEPGNTMSSVFILDEPHSIVIQSPVDGLFQISTDSIGIVKLSPNISNIDELILKQKHNGFLEKLWL